MAFENLSGTHILLIIIAVIVLLWLLNMSLMDQSGKKKTNTAAAASTIGPVVVQNIPNAPGNLNSGKKVPVSTGTNLTGNSYTAPNQFNAELINFYTQWCGHSKRLMPIWTEVAKYYNGSNVAVSSVDCDANPQLAEQFNIRGYPTIILRTPTETVQYTGPHNRDQIITFVNSRISPLQQ